MEWLSAGWVGLVAVLGWLAGALANWAADRLPGMGTLAVNAEGGLSEAGCPPQGLRRAEDQGASQGRTFWHYWTLGWYFLRHGRCPHCGLERPLRAPLLEAGLAVLWVIAWLRFRAEPVKVSLLWIYIIYLLTVTVIDLEHRRVLNIMLIPAALFAFLASLLPGRPEPLDALLGGAIGLGLFLVLALVGRGALGAGDVKLAGVIGLMTGYPQVVSALLIGILLGGLSALLLLISGRRSRRGYMAYAPYLSLGALLVLLGVAGGGCGAIWCGW